MRSASSNNHQLPGTSESTWVQWIGLTALITVSLAATVLLNWTSVVGLVKQCAEIDSYHDPERARFEVSSWLEPYFETADGVRPHLQPNLPLTVYGRQRFFVAYRLQPRVVYLDKPDVLGRLAAKGVDFVRIEFPDITYSAGGEAEPDAGPLFHGDFEKGRIRDWSNHTRKPSKDPR